MFMDIKNVHGTGAHQESSTAAFVSSSVLASLASNPIQGPNGWTYLPIPPGPSSCIGHNAPAGVPHPNTSGQGHFIPSHVNTNTQPLPTADVTMFADMLGSNTSALRTDSMKRKIRTEKKKEADEESRRRAEQGLKPYVV